MLKKSLCAFIQPHVCVQLHLEQVFSGLGSPDPPDIFRRYRLLVCRLLGHKRLAWHCHLLDWIFRVSGSTGPAMAALAMGNSLGEAFRVAILWSCLTIFFIIAPHFLCILDIEMIKICHVYFAFSDINLLGLSGGCLFIWISVFLQAFCIYFWKTLRRNFRMKSLTCMKGMACLLTRVQSPPFKAMFWPITTTITTSFLAWGPEEKWMTQTTSRTHLNTVKPCQVRMW